MLVKLSDLIAFLEDKKINYKKWCFASGSVASIEIDNTTIWERKEKESHGVVLCSKLEAAIINDQKGTKFKKVATPTKSGKVQNRLYWSYDGLEWYWIGKRKPTLYSSSKLTAALSGYPENVIG